MWALNVVTHEQQAIATSSGLNDLASIATDGQTVALISFVGDNHDGVQYDLANVDCEDTSCAGLRNIPINFLPRFPRYVYTCGLPGDDNLMASSTSRMALKSTMIGTDSINGIPQRRSLNTLGQHGWSM